jgi:hypothetical protein
MKMMDASRAIQIHKSNTLSIQIRLALSKTAYIIPTIIPKFSKSLEQLELNPTKIHLDGLLGSSVSFITELYLKASFFDCFKRQGGSLLFE